MYSVCLLHDWLGAAVVFVLPVGYPYILFINTSVSIQPCLYVRHEINSKLRRLDIRIINCFWRHPKRKSYEDTSIPKNSDGLVRAALTAPVADVMASVEHEI
jgi:hypothetical protein